MKYIFAVLMIIGLLISCDPPSCYKPYQFEFPVTSSSSDTFDLGDTVWYEMNLGGVLEDKLTNQYIDISNLDVSFTFMLSDLNSNITHSIPLHIESGNMVSRGNHKVVSFDSISSKQFKFGILVSHRGAYYSSMDMSSQMGNPRRDCMMGGVPNNEGLGITNTECIEYLDYPTGVFFNGGTKSTYSFYVK